MSALTVETFGIHFVACGAEHAWYDEWFMGAWTPSYPKSYPPFLPTKKKIPAPHRLPHRTTYNDPDRSARRRRRHDIHFN